MIKSFYLKSKEPAVIENTDRAHLVLNLDSKP